MKYKKYDLDNYDIHTVTTDRFKTIGLAVTFRIKNEKIHDKYIPMLWRMLIDTNSKYSSLKEISEASANIYDPYINIGFTGSGSEDILTLSGTFINEKYTEKGMNEESIKFLLDFIFKPKIIEGGFDEEMFEIHKAKLIDYYKSTKDYPKAYAESRIHEETQYYDYKEYSLDELIKLTESLTREELYEFYKKIINTGKLDIFICGNFDSDEIKNIISNNIDFKGKKKKKPVHQIIQTTYNKKPKIIIDKSANVQSFLIIAFKVINMTDYESKYVLLIYSWILGGGFNSLLNQKVREENSLCYYIYSSQNSLVSGLKIYAGIDGKNFETVYELIKKELINIENGNFSSELLNSVKKFYYRSLESTEDYQSDMLNDIIKKEFIETDDTKTRKEIMEKLTKEDVMNLAKKIHIDTVYLLKGEKNG